MYSLLTYGSFLLGFIFHYGNSLSFYLQASPYRTWSQAVTDCQNLGMQLAVLNSATDFNDAVAYVTGSGQASIWVGYMNPDVSTSSFQWIDGAPTVFDSWASGDPDMSSGQACVVMKSSVGYTFADRSCGTAYAFLCAGPDITTTVETTTDPCPCCTCNVANPGLVSNYSSYTIDELREILAPVTEKLRQELLVDKTTTSAHKSKYISQKDDRPSAQSIGVIGIVFLSLIAGLTVLADVSSRFKNLPCFHLDK